jgi:hypothetical protein
MMHFNKTVKGIPETFRPSLNTDFQGLDDLFCDSLSYNRISMSRNMMLAFS